MERQRRTSQVSFFMLDYLHLDFDLATTVIETQVTLFTLVCGDEDFVEIIMTRKPKQKGKCENCQIL